MTGVTATTVKAPAGLKAAQGFVGMLATLVGGWWLGGWAGLLLAAGLTLQVESVRWRPKVRPAPDLRHQGDVPLVFETRPTRRSSGATSPDWSN